MDIVTVTLNHPRTFIHWTCYFPHYFFGFEAYPTFNNIPYSKLSSIAVSYKIKFPIPNPLRSDVCNMNVDFSFLICKVALEMSCL